MKVHVEIDCSPEEARAFMGLPDLSKAQAAYSEGMEKAMRGVSNPDQLQELARTMAPITGSLAKVAIIMGRASK